MTIKKAIEQLDTKLATFVSDEGVITFVVRLVTLVMMFLGMKMYIVGTTSIQNLIGVIISGLGYIWHTRAIIYEYNQQTPK